MGVWYTSREDLASALDAKESARNTAQLDRVIESASRAVEALLRRRFYPQVATRTFTVPGGGSLWLNADELISVTTATLDGTVLAAADYDLEPANSGPPYTRFVAPNGGELSILGVFGHSAEEAPAGALAAAIVSTSATTCNVTDSAAVGVGSIIRVDSERMTVTGKAMLTTAQTLLTPVTASVADVALAVTTGSAYVVGEVLLLDSERMLIVDIAGNTLTVRRAWDGSVLASHAGSTIYAPRTLTVVRGALGTTAATHSNSAAIVRHVVPGLVRELAVAESVNTLQQEQSGYARVVGEGENAIEVRGQGLSAIRGDALAAYGRRARTRAI